MQNNALSVANYFVQKSLDERIDLTPLKLNKLVFIAHGYMLALCNETFLDSRFDKVEAWRYGPVIPSVYHSFKHFKNQPIKELTVVLKEKDDGEVIIHTPKLDDENTKLVCDFVWDKYNSYTGSELVTILHRPGTPWWKVYSVREVKEIPEDIIRDYYSKAVEQWYDAINSRKSNQDK